MFVSPSHWVRHPLALVFVAVLALAAAARSWAQTVPFPPAPPAKLALNPVTNKVYVLDELANSVVVVDGSTGATLRTIAVGSRPQFVAVNPVTNRIYVNNGGDATLSVIDGATDTNLTPTALAIGSQGPISINPVTNIVYIVRLTGPGSDEVTFFNANTNTWYTIATSSFQPIAMAVNPVTNTIYVAHYATGDLRVISGAFDPSNDFPATVSIGMWSRPFAVAVNPATNKVYVITEDARGPIAVVDGDTNAAQFPPVLAGHAQQPKALVVNPVSNRVYAAFANEVIVMDGATNAYTYVPVHTGGGAVELGIDYRTNQIYVAADDGVLTILDGDTNTTSTASIPSGANAIGVNAITNKIHVYGSGVTVLDGASGPPRSVPLTTAIAPLPGDTSGADVTFTLNASSGFAPHSLAVRAVFVQLDSQSGAWTRASGGGPFTAAFTGLAPGAHTLHAFAVDGQDAPLHNGAQSIPLVGNVASYTFMVSSSPRSDPTVSLGSSSNPSTAGAAVTFTATVSGGAGAATGSVDFRDAGSSIAGCASVALGGGSAACTTSALSVGTHSITAVYSGSSLYNPATSAAISQLVQASSQTNFALGSGGATASASSSFGPNYAPAALINGDRLGLNPEAGGVWVDGTADAWPDWVQVNLPGARSIERVVVYSLQDNYATNPVEPTDSMTFTQYGVTAFDVQGWNGAAWVTLASVSGNNLVKRSVSFAAFTTDRVRINITAALNGRSRLTEVEVWGTLPGAGANLAAASAGAIATASSSFAANYGPAAVNNGDRIGLDPEAGGVWVDGTADAWPDWVQIAFNGTKTVSSVVLYSLQDNYATSPVEPTDTLTFTQYGITAFDVQGWNGTAWVTLASVSGNNLVKRAVSFAPFATDRIRVNVTGALNAHSRITEIEAFATPVRTNVALAGAGASAFASSAFSANYPAAAAINGDRIGLNPEAGGVWVDATANTWPDWLQVNFNGTKSIDRVVVYTLQDAYATSPAEPTDSMTFTQMGITDFAVQGWSGSGWVTLATVSANNLVKRTVTFGAFTTDRIRISVTGALNGRSRITEVEAWGTDVAFNVALASAGALASATSSFGPAYAPAAVNNNDRAGYNPEAGGVWVDATAGSYPDSVQLDFGRSRTIDRVTLFTLQDSYNPPAEPTDALTFSTMGITAFDVQAWNGTSWVTVASVSGNNLVKRSVSFAPVTTNRIRVNVNASLNSYSRITEIEAWGS